MIARHGESTAEVDSLVERLLVAPGADEKASVLAALEALPSGVPSTLDRDYAALALQVASAAVSDGAFAKQLLHTALDRAIWYASYATSGGEGLSRSKHIEQLRAAYAAA
jgi:hypothetical protein